MPIKNRNIGKGAAIDLAKLEWAGTRLHYEDFDDDTAGDVDNFYGLEKVVDGGTAAVSTAINSCLVLTSAGGNRKAVVGGSNQWSSDRDCRFDANLSTIFLDSQRVNVKIGFVDVAGARDKDADGAAGSDNSAFFMYDSGDTGSTTTWQFRVVNAAGTQTVDTERTVVTSSTPQKLSVELQESGDVVAKIDGVQISNALNKVRTSRTDWVPFVRLAGETSNSQTVNIDSWSTQEDRS